MKKSFVVSKLVNHVFNDDILMKVVDQYQSLIHSVNEARSLVDPDVYTQAVEDINIFVLELKNYLSTQRGLIQVY